MKTPKLVMKLVDTAPAQAKALILGAFEKAECHMGDACATLGIGTSPWYRYVTALKLGYHLDTMRKRAKREGWHHKKTTGRPRKTEPVEA